MVDSTERPVVVGLGEILWDLLPDGKQLGGAPANFTFHAQALGARGYVVSAVGEDAPGREILDRLADLGLTREHIAALPDRATGTVSVTLDVAGTPSYTIHENVAWDFIPESRGTTDLAARTDAVCFGSLAQRNPVSRETIFSFLQAVPEKSLRIFDINLRQSYWTLERIQESLKICNVLKMNHEELPRVAEALNLQGDETSCARQMVEALDLRLLALTHGERGSLLLSPEESSRLEGTPIEVVDSVGAGDAFTAGITMGLLEGLPLETMHQSAHRLASFVCTRKGATPSHPKESKNSSHTTS